MGERKTDRRQLNWLRFESPESYLAVTWLARLNKRDIFGANKSDLEMRDAQLESEMNERGQGD